MNTILKTIIIGFLTGSVPVHAQSTTGCKDSLQVDLGFGIVQNYDKVTASTATIEADELKKTAAINLQDALYGRLLGLTALRKGGFSGDNDYGAALNIRGTQTLTEKGILILVDGFERPIDRLSIDEIEKVTVLKDAAAVALYGYRGINGALLVTTKRGTESGRIIDVGYDHKFVFAPQLPKFVNAHTYANALNEARNNDNLSPVYNQYELDAFKNNTYPSVYPNVNWADEALRNAGSENVINLSIKGGGSRVKYFTLLNYTDSRGLLDGTEMNEGYSTQLKYSKANVRTNLDFKISPTTDMQINVLGSFIETNRPHGINSSSILGTLYKLPAAAFPVKTDDGIWGGNTVFTNSNIVAQIQGTGYDKTHARSLYADAKITQQLSFLIEGLSASVRMGYDNYSEITEQRYKGFEYASDSYIFDTEGNVLKENRYQAGDKASKLTFNKWLNSQWRRSNLVISLDYKKRIDAHNILASFLFTNEVSTNGIAIPSNGYNNDNNKFYRKNISFYLHYDYRDKYLADVALVTSGSNRSYPNKFAFSPTVSVGWLLSKEDFLKENNAINLLKIRASAGILHSDYIPFAGMDLENYGGGSGNYFFGDGYREGWGMRQSYLATKNFNLETAYKYNMGIDLSLQRCLNFTAEVYYQRRNNILMSGEGLTSSVIGLAASYVNKGVVDSKGVEFGLDYNKNFGDFTLSAGGQFTYGTNKIIDLIESPKAYSYLEQKGKPVNQAFGLEAIGFFQTQEEINANKIPQEFAILKPGDVKYKDQNNDGVINENDVIAMGYSSEIPEINYAFTIGLEYKGFGLNALFQGVSHFTKYLGMAGVYVPLVSNQNLSTHYYENRWIAGENNTHAKYPRLTTENSPNNYRSSSIWYANASFLKLRNCELYYRVPKTLLNKTFIKDIRVNLKGENLLSFDGIDVVDPELVSTVYPTCKSVSVGVSMKF